MFVLLVACWLFLSVINQVNAIPNLTKRMAPMSGDTSTGDISLHNYRNIGAEGRAGKCAWPMSAVTEWGYLAAVDGIYGDLDLSQCGTCLMVTAVKLDAAPGEFAGPGKPVYVTISDQRNTKQLEAIYPGIHKGKPGLDLSIDAWQELFGTTAEERFCKDGCNRGRWDVRYEPASDASLCKAKWNGDCMEDTKHATYCGYS